MEIIKTIIILFALFVIIYALFSLFAALNFFFFLKKQSQTEQDYQIKKEIEHDIQQRFNKNDHQ